MRASVLVALIAGCGASPAQPTPVPNNRKAEPLVQDGIEAQIPGDALYVLYEPDPSTPFSSSYSMREGACRTNVAGKIRGGYTVLTAARQGTYLVIANTDRDELVGCLADPAGVKWRATMLDATTAKLVTDYETSWVTWNPHYFIVSVEKPGPQRAPTAEQLAIFHQMHSAKLALWTSLPVTSWFVGVDSRQVLILLDRWEMPREWGRLASGTVTIDYLSPEGAQTGAARVRAGGLTGISDPALLAAARAAPFATEAPAGTRVRHTLTGVDFDLSALKSDIQKRLP